MGSDIESILVGVDLEPDLSDATPGSRDAVSQARWLAGQTRARVTLLHSLGADEHWDAGQAAYVEVAHRGGAPAEVALERIAAQLRSDGIETGVATSDDSAAVAIIRHVLMHRHDMVIVGKRSYQSPKGGRMGTAALRLIRKCPCPAWIVEWGSSGPMKTVLACTDLEQAGDVAVRVASSVASRSGAELHVTYAYQLPLDIQMSGSEVREEWNDERRRQATAHIEDLLEEEQRGNAELHLGLTSPAQAIRESLDRLQPDLLVMGSISRSGLPGILIGNTAERIFASLHCSLLVVKPDDFVSPIQL